jgi:hypothetical protein
VTPQPAEEAPVTTDARADIEKRRKKNLEDTGDPFDYVSKQPRTDGRFNALYTTTKEAAIFNSYQEAVDWINAKYDAEINALKKSKSQLKNKYKGKFIYATPGSGKTTTITARIAYLVEYYDIDPSKILLVTFSRAAAQEMIVLLHAMKQGHLEK